VQIFCKSPAFGTSHSPLGTIFIGYNINFMQTASCRKFPLGSETNDGILTWQLPTIRGACATNTKHVSLPAQIETALAVAQQYGHP
jgi:hypothetical protein